VLYPRFLLSYHQGRRYIKDVYDNTRGANLNAASGKYKSFGTPRDVNRKSLKGGKAGQGIADHGI
jgi:hypothetical protein